MGFWSSDNGVDAKLIATVMLKGGISGSIAKIVANPIENRAMIAYYRFNEEMPFSKILFSQIWKGYSRVVLRYSTNQAIQFTIKDLAQRAFGRSLEKDGFFKWFSCNLASGGISGAISPLVTVPIFNASLRKPTPLYNGLAIACIGNTVFRTITFGFYDSLKVCKKKIVAESSFVSLFYCEIITILQHHSC